MTCPACGSPIEQLYLDTGCLELCGIFECLECRYPDNRWVIRGLDLARPARRREVTA